MQDKGGNRVVVCLFVYLFVFAFFAEHVEHIGTAYSGAAPPVRLVRPWRTTFFQ